MIPKTTQAAGLRTLVFASALMASVPAFAALGASVTLASGQPTDIYPGETTQLQITLSNSNTAAAITAVAFSNNLPGTLPDGLKIAGAASYVCADASGPVAAAGTLTAIVGSQTITLAGGSIPARASSTDGTCTIIVPVTAGTSFGSTATYTYAVANGAVTGDDGVPVANSGAVNQSINVRALAQPTIAKSFGSSTLVLGGSATTLTITLTNTNPVPIPNFSVTDAFPALGAGGGIIKVAATPSATASCNNGGTAPTFAPAAGVKTLTATGTVPAKSGVTNGSCTLTVQVEADHTNAVYSTGAQTNTINRSTQFTNDVGIVAAANATANITVRSPLRVTKSVNAAAVATGQAGLFTITLFNDGPSPLTAAFTDDAIDGLTPGAGHPAYGLTVTGHSTTCASGVTAATTNNTGISLTGGTIAAGSSCTVTVNFTGTVQTPNTPRSYTNTIIEGAVNVGVSAITSQAASAAVTVYENLSVSKSISPASAAPGNPVRYQVTVQNWSAADVNNVAITDTLANSQTFLTGVVGANDYTPSLSGTGCVGLSVTGALGAVAPVFAIGTLPQRSGVNTPGSCTVTFWAMTSVTAANGSTYSNSLAAGSVCYNAGATCNGGASNSVSGSVTTSVLSASKTFTQGGTTNPPSALARAEGTVVRMTITLSNLSANPLTSVAISDTLPTSGGAQLRVATPANAATTCSGSPTITAVANSTSVSMNGATIPARAASGTGAAGSCLLQVDVIGPAGTYNNTATVTGTETYANGSTHTAGPVSSNVATLTYTSALAATKSFVPTSVSSGGRSTVTVRLNNSGAVALTNVAVTDPLPTGMVLATPPSAYTTCAGSTSVTAVAGASSVSMSGAGIAGGGNCDFIFDVTASGSANWVNTIPAGNISADGGVSNQVAVAGTLNYSAPTNLTVAKATNPSTLTFPGQVSQLTITINNGSQAVTGLRLTDYFTANGTSGAASNGMAIAATPAASTSCPGGVVSATAGATLLTLSGATLSAGASCTVTINVTSTSVGGITNYIPVGGIVTDQGLTSSGQATTSLTTQSNIGVTKQFTPNVVKPGERSRLRITFYNPTAQPATNLAVTDNLPAGVTVPSGPTPLTTCAGATVSSPVSTQVLVSGGSIVAASGGIAASCYAEIDVVVAAQGDYVNTIAAGAVSAVIGGASTSNSQPASDTLRAKSPLTFHKAFSSKTLDAGNPVGLTTASDSKAPGATATMTIRLDNPNAVNLTSAAFTDTLPTGLVVATPPNASTTCAGGTVTAAASGTTVKLTGATLPASGFCTVTVSVLSNISGSYTNTIAAGGVTTFEGVSNEEPTSARLVVSTPPTVNKQFSPAVIAPGNVSTLTIVLGNANSSAVTLTSAFTDTLPTAPGNIIVAPAPNKASTCGGGVGAVSAIAGSATVTLASGSTIPAGGCSISVDVTGLTPGEHTNNIPAGSLLTDFGNNQQPANAVLKVSTLGYIAGRVFQDNNVIPDGAFQTGTDAPIQGTGIELHSGANCSGALVSIAGLTNPATTDALGNYMFSGLPAGTYSVCEPVQPAGTSNGITTAGGITTVSGSTGTSGSASNPTSSSSQVAGIILNAAGGGEISGSSGNNFAEVVLSSISGTVFLDQNNNGIQNGVDAGIAGVTIELLNNAGTVVATTTTDAAGNYSFTGLVPGNYSVREPTQPTGTSNGVTTAGAVGHGGTAGSATGVSTLPSVIGAATKITLPPNTAATANNFAEIPNGRTLAGRVFLDYNNSGTLNGPDHGIGLQTINLSGTDLNGNAVTRTTTTVSDGSYSFAGLPEGTYLVTQPVQPAGTTNGITTPGSTGGAASTAGVVPSVISVISLVGANTVSANNDFAEVPNAAPDLAIAKTHTPASFGQNSSTGYFTITPSNIGTVSTTGVMTVLDTLPAGMTVAAQATGTGWACTGAVGATAVTCTSSNVIAAGATGSPITLRVTVANGLTGQILTNTAVISGGGEPPGFDGNNTVNDPVAISTAAQVSGTVWTDTNHDRVLDAGETRLPDWQVELLLGNVVVATTTTGSNGTYAFTALAPGSGYQLRFRHPTTGVIWGSAVTNEQGIAVYGTSVNGVRDTGSATVNHAQVTAGNPAGASVTGDGTLLGLTLLAGDNIVQQSLPLDPAGVVYDALTRQPVAGAVVTVAGPATFNPTVHLVGGAAAVTTGADGLYQFLLVPGAPNGVYTLTVTTYPSGYVPATSTLIPACANTLSVNTTNVGPNPALVQPLSAAPASGIAAHNAAACPSSTTGLPVNNTQYWLSFSITAALAPFSAHILNNHIPLDPYGANVLVLAKSGSASTVELGDSLQYTLQLFNRSAGVLRNVQVVDTLPAGFRYIAGTSALAGAKVADPVGGAGPVLNYGVGSLAANSSVLLTYRVRVAVGAQQGTGINRAQAQSGSIASNTAQWKVRVTGGVFTDEACVLGKVFVDCNGNHIQDAEELGIPGVRLYLQDGTYLISDSEGKYSICNLPPRTHVLKVDKATLPRGSRLMTSSNRNAGDAGSLFLDLKAGELHRADFIEGSCSNTVLEQVKARRTQGEVSVPQTEKKSGAPLRFESKPARAPQEATDSANQSAVKPRYPVAPDIQTVPSTAHELNVPVPLLPMNQQPKSGGNANVLR